MNDPQSFRDLVAAWCRSMGDDACEVVKVEPYGTDWAGDTDAGFYSTFDLCIVYLTSGGDERRRSVKGEELESLWRAAVNPMEVL